MTAPSEEQVMAWLENCAETMEAVSRLPFIKSTTPSEEAALHRAALALLDAGRKDRERLDWMDEQTADVTVEDNECGSCAVRSNVDYLLVGHSPSGYNIRAAIDRARGA